MRGSGRWRTAWRNDRGSNVAQAAAVAIMAAALIGVLLLGARDLTPRVEGAFRCLVGSLGGGGGDCSAGAATAANGTQPNSAAIQQLSNEPCPAAPNAGYLNSPQPTDLANLYRTLTRQYQQPDQTVDTQNGPVGITQIGDNRYMVTLVGIEWQSFGDKFNFLPNAIRDELGIESKYHAHVRDLIQAQIPPGAEIVFAAHSHGGIVSQNLARDGAINGPYRVTNVITYGSPVSGPPVDGVNYTMFEVSGDIVPGAAITHLPSFIRMYRRGDYHIIPPDKFHLNPMAYHSAYAEALEKLMQDPEQRQLADLPFTIDQWGRTETFHANDQAARDLRANCP